MIVNPILNVIFEHEDGFGFLEADSEKDKIYKYAAPPRKKKFELLKSQGFVYELEKFTPLPISGRFECWVVPASLMYIDDRTLRRKIYNLNTGQIYIPKLIPQEYNFSNEPTISRYNKLFFLKKNELLYYDDFSLLNEKYFDLNEKPKLIEISLNDGGKLTGELLEELPDVLRVKTNMGELEIDKSLILKKNLFGKSKGQVFLKDGSVLFGTIEEKSFKEIRLLGDLGALTISREQVEKIQESASSAATFQPSYQILSTKESYNQPKKMFSNVEGFRKSESQKSRITFTNSDIADQLFSETTIDYTFAHSVDNLLSNTEKIIISGIQIKIRLTHDYYLLEERYYSLNRNIELIFERGTSIRDKKIDSLPNSIKLAHEIELDPICQFAGFNVIPVLGVSDFIKSIDSRKVYDHYDFFVAKVFLNFVKIDD
ncbi:MAG: hypothetical protein JXQ96_02535 [Cyclobacteriaceae bacterium]